MYQYIVPIAEMNRVHATDRTVRMMRLFVLKKMRRNRVKVFEKRISASNANDFLCSPIYRLHSDTHHANLIYSAASAKMALLFVSIEFPPFLEKINVRKVGIFGRSVVKKPNLMREHQDSCFRVKPPSCELKKQCLEAAPRKGHWCRCAMTSRNGNR
jgi:hypothetical protein